MIIYLVFFSVFFLGETLPELFLRNHLKAKRISEAVFGGVLLMVFSGIKGVSVGRDTINYYNFYVSLKNVNFWTFPSSGFEEGFVLLCKIGAKVGLPFWLFSFLLYFLIYSSLSFSIYKNSASIPFSFLIFFCSGFFVFNLSGLRQALAISMILMAFEILKRSNFWSVILFIIIVLLAFTIHRTSIVFLVALLGKKVNLTMKSTVLVIPLLLLIFFLSPKLYEAGFYLYGKSTYFPTTSEGGGQFLLYLVFLIASIFISEKEISAPFFNSLNGKFTKKKGLNLDCFDSIDERFSGQYTFLFLFGVLFQSFSLASPVFPRMGLYFSIFQIFVIPIALKQIPKGFSKFVLSFSVILFYIFFFYFYSLRTNSLDILPYSFFWS